MMLKKMGCVAFMATICGAWVCGITSAGPFGLFHRRGGSRGDSTGGPAPASVDGELHTAQGVANRMARLCRMMHMGNPTGGFEGVGMASTPDGALANTCRPHNGPPRDWGVAQGANGMFYACRRW
jgi:hypothetical protein